MSSNEVTQILEYIEELRADAEEDDSISETEASVAIYYLNEVFEFVGRFW